MAGISSPLKAIVTTARNGPLVAEVHAFRRRLFVDALGWNLRLDGAGGERDEFDTDRAIHVALLSGSEVVGSFRALRADGPYLAADVFAHLATELPYPTDAQAWEISRFGVRPDAGQNAVRALYSTMFRFAHLRQARALVALVDLAHERLLSSLGIVTRRYGGPHVVGHDRAGRPLTAVAGEIPVTEQEGLRFARLVRLSQQLEIIDEALVLGLERLSA